MTAQPTSATLYTPEFPSPADLFMFRMRRHYTHGDHGADQAAAHAVVAALKTAHHAAISTPDLHRTFALWCDIWSVCEGAQRNAAPAVASELWRVLRAYVTEFPE